MQPLSIKPSLKILLVVRQWDVRCNMQKTSATEMVQDLLS
jgi:hypothetical protein